MTTRLPGAERLRAVLRAGMDCLAPDGYVAAAWTMVKALLMLAQAARVAQAGDVTALQISLREVEAAARSAARHVRALRAAAADVAELDKIETTVQAGLWDMGYAHVGRMEADLFFLAEDGTKSIKDRIRIDFNSDPIPGPMILSSSGVLPVDARTYLDLAAIAEDLSAVYGRHRIALAASTDASAQAPSAPIRHSRR